MDEQIRKHAYSQGEELTGKYQSTIEILATLPLLNNMPRYSIKVHYREKNEKKRSRHIGEESLNGHLVAPRREVYEN